MNNQLPPGRKPDVKKKLVVTGDGGCGKVSLTNLKIS